MKRIFIGIKIKGLREEVAIFKDKYRQLPVRWVVGENLHITLIAPWEAREEEVEEMKRKLVNTNFVQPFEINFEKIIYGPNMREPRLIWAEGKAPEEVIKLSKKLEETLGIKNNRPFLLHLTLARFRPEAFFSFPVKNLDEEVNWKEKVEGFELIESILLPEGPKYIVLKEFKFYV